MRFGQEVGETIARPLNNTSKGSSCQENERCVRMVDMEISVLPGNIIKLKTKLASFLINPTEKVSDASGAIFFSTDHKLQSAENVVVIDGPGDFEIGGVKFSGISSGSEVVYSFLLDGVDVMIGKIESLDKIQHKVKEHDAVIVCTDGTPPGASAFVTGLATSYVMAVGNDGKALIDSFGKENPQELNKITITKDKLPTEMETIILTDSK